MTTTATNPKQCRHLPAGLKPEWITALVDIREQRPLDLAPLRTETKTLTTGDYSVAGLEHVVAVERKSLADLVLCVGKERKRFEREVQRLLAYPVRAIVVESSWADLELGNWRSQVTPESAVGSVLGWIAQGLPVVMAGNRKRAEEYVVRLLLITVRRRWREALALLRNVVS